MKLKIQIMFFEHNILGENLIEDKWSIVEADFSSLFLFQMF